MTLQMLSSLNIIIRKSINWSLCCSLTETKQDLSLSISTNGAASISVSVEVNGTIYSGKSFSFKGKHGFALPLNPKDEKKRICISINIFICLY